MLFGLECNVEPQGFGVQGAARDKKRQQMSRRTPCTTLSGCKRGVEKDTQDRMRDTKGGGVCVATLAGFDKNEEASSDGEAV